MNHEIIVALISGLATVSAVVITSRRAGKDMDAKLDKQQAVTETKLDALTREVRRHNDFAHRLPVVEEQIRTLCGRMESLEGRMQK